MVWACFGFNGISDIAFICGRQMAKNDQNKLDEHILPIAEDIGGPEWIFQQYRASMHQAHSTGQWF